MLKTLLFVSAGLEAVAAIKLAKDMGLHVVVSDKDPSAPGFEFADDKLIVSTYNIEGTLIAAKKYHGEKRPIDGVICVASDVSLTVATIAAELGLPGVSLESARLSMDKMAMKDRFKENGIPIPWYSKVDSFDHLKQIITDRDYSLVLKPADSRGARGVLRLTADVDIKWAFSFSKNCSPTGRIMVEQFLPGPQVSTESIIIDGAAYTPGFSDRNYEYLETYAPFIIENGGELPSHLSNNKQQEVRNLIQNAAQSMGVKNGVVKGDVVIYNDSPYLIELAARLSGGYFCTIEIPLNTGVDFVGCAIRQALGEKIDTLELVPRFQRAVAQRYFFPKPGRVIHINGVNEMARRPYVSLCEVRVAVGDIIGPIENHPSRAGVVITTGKTNDQAVERAEKVIQTVEISTISV